MLALLGVPYFLISFFGKVRGYYKRPNGMVCKEGHEGARFKVLSCVQREWIVRGGGLYGYFWEQQ